jgi:hypothetical protein
MGKDAALIITSSVFVTAGFTVLIDPDIRREQYMSSIEFFIKESVFRKIIVCDNSQFVYPASLQELAKMHQKEIELLSFKGDSELTRLRGKGYGEGEIMNYIFNNSNLLRSVDAFFKVTGRMTVKNVNAIIRFVKNKPCYFMSIPLRPRFMKPDVQKYCVDTRFYYAKKAFFSEVLINAYNKVNDAAAHYLEHAYYDSIKQSSITPGNFIPVPEIIGVAASQGTVCKERSLIKKLVVNIMVLLRVVRTI